VRNDREAYILEIPLALILFAGEAMRPERDELFIKSAL
jgi:hypothetical protein